jgi:feruloyl esterase
MFAVAAAMLMFATGLQLFAARDAHANLTCNESTLQGIAPKHVTIAVATETTLPPPFTASYCSVIGFITTLNPGPNQVGFEVDLPDTWNGRLAFEGNGGFAGTFQAVGTAVYNETLQLGYVAAATDTGHTSQFPPELADLDGSFLYKNLAKQADFSYRSVHVSTETAKSLIAGYYGTAAARSYYLGCSTGGRQGLVEAQLYPADFDGLLVGDPGSSDPIAGFNWNVQALVTTADSWLSPTNITLLDSSVLAECDGKDGVVDQLIQDPRKCDFDPTTIECSNDNVTGCLNADQVTALQKIWAGAKTKNGLQLYPGYTQSDPGGTDGWEEWLTGFTAPTLGVSDPWGSSIFPLQFVFQDQFLKFGTFSNPNYDSLDFSFSNGSDVSKLTASVAKWGGSGVNPNLWQLVNHGRKLLMYHGWSDPAISPFVSINYYNSVNAALGNNWTRTRNTARLFMVPGMHHCTGGPGPNEFDALTPLVEWVENGSTPDNIVALNPDTGRTMPLCAYPETARYDGVGPVDVASSWICK